MQPRPYTSKMALTLGTLCIIDRKPRELESAETELLRKMAALVMDQMELRLAAKRIAEL